jgi:acetoin utilization protein AcuB
MSREFGQKVSEVMTKLPRCIEPHQSLELALTWMDELKVRHLPVRAAGKVVGILSDRDFNVLSSGDKSLDISKIKVEEAMISSVVTVSESDLVKDVASKMLEHRVGSVVVTDTSGAVAGIFTDTDALKILSAQS